MEPTDEVEVTTGFMFDHDLKFEEFDSKKEKKKNQRIYERTADELRKINTTKHATDR